MNNVTDSSVGFYNKVYGSYREENYFQQIKITINYIKNSVGVGSDKERIYRINSLSLGCDDKDIITTTEYKDIEDFIKKCNDNLGKKSYPYEWQIFYLYKELFQFFISDKYNYNFFRGQAHDYSLVPGILREAVQNSYRNDFENLYLKIANEFPDKISYFSLSSREEIDKREYQLSLLQHFGLKTSLLDITSNPYIAMLFMLSEGSADYKEPTLFLFRIDEKIHKDKHLFTEVKKSKLNERIIAQKGAFLNFDKIFENRSYDIEKIPRVKIVLHFDSEGFKSQIEKEKRELLEVQEKTELPITNSRIMAYYEALDDEVKNIDKTKVDYLKYIKDELSNKLREYCYFEEDLFPDFEKRIQYLSDKYEAIGLKKISQ
ncbi:FRG domain-containing protein [Lactococcus sp. S47]|uniref:FRG domain-containing protein n=1 Tax=Lactococcus sp. S47 TaxID=2767460 RepID=UPI0019036085|nr:FRG domain-containing protein [Lactococcus sp. S47]MBK0029265.1 FRG domain-containing protein [Lactococcus sp. S47]